MGNQVHSIDRNDPNFKTAIHNVNYLTKKRDQFFLEDDQLPFNGKVQLKWKQSLVQSLKKEAHKRRRNQKDQLITDLEQIIRNIRQDCFIKAVSVFNTMASSKVTQNASKGLLKRTFVTKISQQHKSQNVRIQIDSRFWKGEGLDSVSTGSVHSTGGSFIKSSSNIKRTLQKTISKQINQQYHPIRKIKDSFVMMLQMKYRSRLDQNIPKTKKERELILEQIHDDIDFYCCFVSQGSSIYRNWIKQLAGVKDSKYEQYSKRIVLQSLFIGVSLSQQIFPLIRQICSPQIIQLVQKLPSQVDIKKFNIKEGLSIEGAFMNSLMRLSDFDAIQSPNFCMQKLQTIKTQICYDIDQYHKIFDSKKNYKIDGDNLLSIICFLLCRMKPKLFEIYTQLNLLNAIFGDDAVALFEDASYLLVTFLAAFEYLTNEDFIKSL